eukprot:SM000003S11076  [mRNA]  locus=s3:739303:741360:+ [translate_table: standard]
MDAAAIAAASATATLAAAQVRASRQQRLPCHQELLLGSKCTSRPPSLHGLSGSCGQLRRFRATHEVGDRAAAASRRTRGAAATGGGGGGSGDSGGAEPVLVDIREMPDGSTITARRDKAAGAAPPPAPAQTAIADVEEEPAEATGVAATVVGEPVTAGRAADRAALTALPGDSLRDEPGDVEPPTGDQAEPAATTEAPAVGAAAGSSSAAAEAPVAPAEAQPADERQAGSAASPAAGQVLELQRLAGGNGRSSEALEAAYEDEELPAVSNGGAASTEAGADAEAPLRLLPDELAPSRPGTAEDVRSSREQAAASALRASMSEASSNQAPSTYMTPQDALAENSSMSAASPGVEVSQRFLSDTGRASDYQEAAVHSSTAPAAPAAAPAAPAAAPALPSSASRPVLAGYIASLLQQRKGLAWALIVPVVIFALDGAGKIMGALVEAIGVHPHKQYGKLLLALPGVGELWIARILHSSRVRLLALLKRKGRSKEVEQDELQGEVQTVAGAIARVALVTFVFSSLSRFVVS